MDASSVSEEDIVEICITKGHTHPLGVLCYSATELVVSFNRQVTVHYSQNCKCNKIAG